MPLHKIEGEDLRKIHAEVVQLVNQRFLITTLAVTLFGVISAWVLSRIPESAGQPVGGTVYGLSVLHGVLLLVLFWYQHSLKQMLRVFSSYLVTTGASDWENDWKAFRGKLPYLGYSKPIAVVFLALGAMIGGLPLLLIEIRGLTYAPISGLWAMLVTFVVVVLTIVLLGFCNVADHEGDAEKAWRELGGD